MRKLSELLASGEKCLTIEPVTRKNPLPNLFDLSDAQWGYPQGYQWIYQLIPRQGSKLLFLGSVNRELSGGSTQKDTYYALERVGRDTIYLRYTRVDSTFILMEVASHALVDL